MNPHVPPPSKIIMSEIFNLYELSNYMKKKTTKIGFLFCQNARLKQKGTFFIEVVGGRSSTIWQDSGNDRPIHILLLWNLYEGGVTVCGDAVLLDFAAVFAGIFTLSCGIGVLQNQVVCGI